MKLRTVNSHLGVYGPVMSRLMYSATMCAVLGVTGSPARSQGYPFSQRGTVTQMVAYTEISVSYGRPVARGRELFGALVPWDSVWHPGAEEVSHIESFAIYFPKVLRDEAVMRLHWGTTAVPIRIKAPGGPEWTAISSAMPSWSEPTRSRRSRVNSKSRRWRAS